MYVTLVEHSTGPVFLVMRKFAKTNGWPLQLLKLFAQFRKLMPMYLPMTATSVLIFM